MIQLLLPFGVCSNDSNTVDIGKGQDYADSNNHLP